MEEKNDVIGIIVQRIHNEKMRATDRLEDAEFEWNDFLITKHIYKIARSGIFLGEIMKTNESNKRRSAAWISGALKRQSIFVIHDISAL